MKILVTYATMGGSTQMVADKIYQLLNSAGTHQVSIEDMDKLTPESFLDYELVFIGSSTYGDGEYNDISMSFFDKVKASSVDLSSVKFAIYGLGESFYPIFCNVVDLMKDDLSAKNAVIIGEPIKIDGFPDDTVMSAVESWVIQIMTQ